ncbi:hypothetical protein WDW37_08235 [Bdellovibrionota bacterium FG-1]
MRRTIVDIARNLRSRSARSRSAREVRFGRLASLRPRLRAILTMVPSLRLGMSMIHFVLVFGALVGRSEAAEFHPLYRSLRSAAMGGAYVALADDENAIFLNPAGLASVKKITFNYASVDLEMSTDVVTTGMTGAGAFSSLGISTLNAFMGKNIFAHGQIAPSLLMPHFGLAFLSDHQFSLQEQNEANPQINLGYQSTNGIQVAFGTSVLRRGATRSDFRVGAAAKMMWRRGGYHDLSFLDVLRLSQNAQGYINDLTGSYGRGYGADVGLQYLFKATKKLTLSSGLAMTDIGNTTFDSPQADSQKSDLTWGMAATYHLSKARLNLAYDLKGLTDTVEFRKRSHLGLEFSVPLISVYAGLYQMALSYGAAVDLWLFKVTVASYSEEQGTFATQNPERRYALRIALKVGF